LQKNVEENPNDAFARYLLALELNKLNCPEEAIAHFETLIREHAEYVPTYYQLAQVYENLGRTNEAIRVYHLGLKAARHAGDLHTASEIQAALDGLE
jgi:tetratricopeptide (TPR) repeat protein